MRTIVLALAACVGAAGCAGDGETGALPPFQAAYSVYDLMEGPVGHASEVYWGSVSTIVDANGITENFPRTDEEWEAVWAAAVTLAESGNLLMMAPRARDDGDWMTYAAAMVEVGIEAADAAEARNPDRVLEVGERVYNACVACHTTYYPESVQ